MANDSLIPDDLLRQIIGVGQVDLLVGLPTHDLGDGAAAAVQAIRGCFRTHFPRLRTALLNVDRGSTDGTPDMVQQCWDGGGMGATGSSGLRTMHCMTASEAAWREDGMATRCVLAAGDLLQAGTVVVLDADVEGMTPAWVAALAAPVRNGQADLVAPVYRRHAAEGSLVTQLVRPLLRAVYGRHLHEPLLAEFGCSGRLATTCTQVGWDTTPAQRATHLWITGEALRGDFTLGQADLGARRLRSDRRKAGLPEVFRQVVGSAFATIEAHAAHWTTVQGVAEVPVVGAPAPPDEPGPAPSYDASPLVESFARDVETIDEILRRILAPGTLTAVTAGSRRTPPQYPAEVWAATVIEFLVAYHLGVMHRDHVAQALLPLYTARTGVFLLEHGEDAAEALEMASDDVCRAFERVRPEIIERWQVPA
ncbi:MAG: hypothetical protein AB7G23_15325 [Vicinamibacterales bacterium]